MGYMESGFQWTKCLKQSPCLSIEVTVAYGSISSLLLISKAHYFVFAWLRSKPWAQLAFSHLPGP